LPDRIDTKTRSYYDSHITLIRFKTKYEQEMENKVKAAIKYQRLNDVK